jgi:hypothetical protein
MTGMRCCAVEFGAVTHEEVVFDLRADRIGGCGAFGRGLLVARRVWPQRGHGKTEFDQ